MAPSIQAQHVVAVTIPTIAVLFLSYLWYKKRSTSITRSRNDPGGGGGTSRKRTRHRNAVSTASSATTTATSVAATMLAANSSEQEIFPEAMKNAMQKAIRDLETALPIQEICSDAEENQLPEADSKCDLRSAEAQPNKSHSPELVQLEDNNNDSPAATMSLVVADAAAVHSQNLKDANAEAEAVSEEMVARVMKLDLRSETAAAVSNEKREADAADVELCASVSDSEPRKSADVEKTRSEGGFCALTRQQFDCKSGAAKKPENSSSDVDVNDDLGVAMQKLESMRLSDKSSKRGKSSNVSKRQNHLSKDADNLISNNNNNNSDISSSVTQRPKTPPSVLSQLVVSPPSKARKRKAKKRSKANQNGNNSDDGGGTCKAQSDEVTPEMRSTCDSMKSFDSCVNRTSAVADGKCTSRNWAVDTDKLYLSSHGSDSLSCNKESDDCDLKVIENHQENCDNERDSANHSPVDTILDSQSVQFSDAHSEGSSDSGKGCSEGAVSPSPQTPAGGSSISGDQNMVLVYQFVIPQEHVGKLIGKHGQFINTIKANSNTRIYIKKHPISFKKKICALEGTQQEINKALELIRIRFPEDTYPDVTLEEFPISQPIACPLRPELFQLDLVEGVNNDVVISSVVNAGHLFLQQPMHPTYQSLTLLNLSMNQVYNSPEAPLVLKPAKDNIVAAPAMGGWYRAQITSVDEETETCDVRFLDYGGYLMLNTSCLRAVRADFLTLPFQAVECFLANVTPINDIWCDDAKLLVQGLTYGQILQAQVYDYTPEGIPLILLYAVHGTQVILINQELIARGFAYPTSNEGAQSDEILVYS